MATSRVRIMESKLRVLLLTSSYPAHEHDARASAGMFVRDFAQELATRIDLRVLTQHTGSGASLVEERGYQVHRFSWAGGDRALANLRLPRDLAAISSVLLRGLGKTLQLVREHDVDHIFALWAVPSGVWALAAKWVCGVRYSVWCLGQDVWNYKSNIITRWLLRLILRQAHAVYADGFALRNEVYAIGGRECAYLPSSRRLRAQGDAQTEVVAAKRNYLFIGRYHHNKGPDVLLRAILELPLEVRQGSYFHFFGGGPLEAALRKVVDEDGLADCVTINGYIDEDGAVAYLKQCDCVVIPSRLETISMVVWDALQLATPIIASDAGDMGHFFDQHAIGLVVKAGSAKALARAITQEYHERPDYARARSELLEQFGVHQAVDQFIAAALESPR